MSNKYRLEHAMLAFEGQEKVSWLLPAFIEN